MLELLGAGGPGLEEVEEGLGETDEKEGGGREWREAADKDACIVGACLSGDDVACEERPCSASIECDAPIRRGALFAEIELPPPLLPPFAALLLACNLAVPFPLCFLCGYRLEGHL